MAIFNSDGTLVTTESVLRDMRRREERERQKANDPKLQPEFLNPDDKNPGGYLSFAEDEVLYLVARCEMVSADGDEFIEPIDLPDRLRDAAQRMIIMGYIEQPSILSEKYIIALRGKGKIEVERQRESRRVFRRRS